MLRIGVTVLAAAGLALVGAATASAPRSSDLTCYSVSGPPPRREVVVVRDQLGKRRARIAALLRVCKPARRGSKAGGKGKANFTCYATKPKRKLRRSVTVENVFGTQTLATTRADSLCLPATAGPSALDLVRGADPVRLGNAFGCYTSTAATFRRRRIRVSDAFRRKARIAVRRPVLFCAPADVRRGKLRTRVRDAAARLVCYAVTPRKTIGRKTLALNELGLFELRVGRLATLCLASANAPPPEPLTLTVELTGPGSVAGDPAGISCPGACQAAYPAGTKVTLTASGPANWTGCDSTTATTCTVTMRDDRTVAAELAPRQRAR